MNGRKAKQLRRNAKKISTASTQYMEDKPPVFVSLPRKENSSAIAWDLVDKLRKQAVDPVLRGIGTQTYIRMVKGTPRVLDRCFRSVYQIMKKNSSGVAQGAN